MRNRLLQLLVFAGLLWMSCTTSVYAKFGLGTTVAKESVKVFDKAAGIDPARKVGDAVSQLLPSCPSDNSFYTALPVNLADVTAIDPLGHVNPAAHTLPADHIYFYFQPVSTSAPFGTRVTATVYAPGDLHITDIASSEILTANPPITDYAIYFYSCREVKSYYGHVSTLDPALLAKVGAIDQNCTTYSTGGATFHRCDQPMNLAMSAGEKIGTAGTFSAALDFGSYDYRQTRLAFTSPTRHYSDQAFTRCPVDFFTPSLIAQMNPMLGYFGGGHPRTEAPVCGQIMFDVANTAQGDWYKIGSPDSPEDPHLALIYNNAYATEQTISVGTSVSGVTPSFWTFVPVNSGSVDRNFSQVTADGNVYCYDTFFDPANQPASPGYSFIIQMPTSTTLKIEKYPNPSCGLGPWTLTSAAAEFQR